MEIKINKTLVDSTCINGIIGDYNTFVNDLKRIDFDNNNIIIDKKKLTKEEKRNLHKKIAIVEKNISDNYKILTVYDFMKLYVLENYLILKDYKKKIKDSLKIVGLTNYHERLVNTLSSSEIKLLLLATTMLSNPDIIVIDDLFTYFDIKWEKKVLSLLNQLVDKYKKVIIICTNDSEFVYKYTKNLICFSNDKILIQGNTDYLFEENTSLLMNNKIGIPKTILFTNLVLKKDIKLNYSKDIRDLIKDIYKKV